MTDIAADLRDAAFLINDDTELAARLEALADAVEAKDPTAWGMERMGEHDVAGPGEEWWRFPTEGRFPTATETEDA